MQLKAHGWWGRGTGNIAKRTCDECYAHGWGQDAVQRTKDEYSELVCDGCRRELGLPPGSTWWTEQTALANVATPIPMSPLMSRLESMELRLSQLEEHQMRAQTFFDQTLRNAPE